jgi:predicted lipoprotein with Yx(FWY)xxD motif
MPAPLRFLFPTLAVSLSLAACGSSYSGSASVSTTHPSATSSAQAGAATTSSAGSAVVKVASNPGLHASVLTDVRGMTLYRLSAEQGGKFICTSASCLAVWHPLRAAGAGPPVGSVGSLGTLRRPDGSRQVTFRGMPLYTFAQDQQPGDAKGQGLKDVGTWEAASTGTLSAPPAPPPASPQSTAPSGSTPGYHY